MTDSGQTVTITLGVPGKNDVVLAAVEQWIEQTGNFAEIPDRVQRVEDAIAFLLGAGIGALSKMEPRQ